MSKTMRKIVWFFAIYLLIFWVGFKGGEIYNISKNKIKRVAIPLPSPPPSPPVPVPKIFFVVEKVVKADYTSYNFEEINDKDTIMKLFQNKKLKPLLKLRHIRIYTEEGERIY